MAPGLKIVEFTSLATAERDQLASLQVSKQQEVFGGSFQESIDACNSDGGDRVRGWCFTLRQAVIGMVVFKRPPASPAWVSSCDMSIHGLKFDQRWQGRGLGKEALRLAVEAAAHTWPDAENLVLAVDADNERALAIYRGFGMTDSGPMYSGRNGLEHRMRKRLER